MASSLFIQIDDPNHSNLNITQDNETINRIVFPYPSLVLANRIIRIVPNEIQTIAQLRGDH